MSGHARKKTTKIKREPAGARRRSNAVQRKPRAPTTERGRATRERLKSAFVALLRDHAFHEIRLEDITREAGVRVSLFYHYFQSKVDIAHEVFSELIDSFKADVTTLSREHGPLEAIHRANQRMVSLYATNPGAMACLVEVQHGTAPFAPLWRELTLDWNQRIAANIARQFPGAFANKMEYLALAYSLAGMVDNFLYEYYILDNPHLRKACRNDLEVAHFLTALWFRMLYLQNPPTEFLGALTGFEQLARTAAKESRTVTTPA